MIHLRVVSPFDTTSRVLASLRADPAVLDLTVLPSAQNPEGDVLQFDVLRGATNRVITQLRALELDVRGSIVLEAVDVSISAAAERATKDLMPFEAFCPVWDEVESRIRAQGQFPPSWFALLVIAGLIAAIGILTNSQILIVGAMVVGPEYDAITSLAFGLNRRDVILARRSATALGLGFGLAIVGALVFGVTVRWSGLESRAYSVGIRPVSNLIDTPNAFSLAVAALAGIVGVIALTESRFSALIGVFISVTTIPAAADTGVSVAFGLGQEARGSAIQLLLNIAVLTAVAVIGLPVQRALWDRRARRASRPATG